MGLNLDKPERWKADAAESVDFYNDWFLRFAPQAYRDQRGIRTKEVQDAFRHTENLLRLSPEVLRSRPGILPILRMITAPPIARDRLAGLAHVSRTIVEAMEGKEGKPPRLPPRISPAVLSDTLQRMTDVVRELLDVDLLPWVASKQSATEQEIDRAAIVVADRLCGAAADPIIRNAQKFSQLRTRYGKDVTFILLLCGYFETSYLGYEAAEGIDWVWEHRLGDLDALIGGNPKRQSASVREPVGGYASKASETMETERFALQQAVDESKSGEERNRMGQFSTPYALARQIVSGTISHLPPTGAVRFLEPALGTGVFFSALRGELGDRQLPVAVGVEIDTAYAEIAKRLWNPLGLTVETADFVKFSQEPANQGRFNLLCTNPPYVRHHHLESVDKVAMQAMVLRSLGLSVSGLSGLYVYFILLADSMLAEDGVASWLLPAEFLYVNYGKPLREYLTRHVTLLGLHHFDPEDVQFDDALVSSCIITYRKRRPSRETMVPFTSGAALDAPARKRLVSAETLTGMDKWTISHLDAGHSPETEGVRLGQLFDVRRGIATGDNDFFILSAVTATEFCIPKKFLRPILPSPRYLKTDIIQTTATGEPVLPDVRYLLDCDLPPDQVERDYPGLWAYLEMGRSRGVHEGYLCTGRNVWYRQERRLPSPFLVTYMGRAVEGRASPIRFILNLSRAIATNVYLYLYPYPQLGLTRESDANRLREIFDALRAIPLNDVLRAGRTYGGGLHKVEPKELTAIILPAFPTWATDCVSRQPMLV